jgi:hypothetical protein
VSREHEKRIYFGLNCPRGNWIGVTSLKAASLAVTSLKAIGSAVTSMEKTDLAELAGSNWIGCN